MCRKRETHAYVSQSPEFATYCDIICHASFGSSTRVGSPGGAKTFHLIAAKAAERVAVFQFRYLSIATGSFIRTAPQPHSPPPPHADSRS